MFQTLKTFSKRAFLTAAPFVAVFAVVTLVDLMLQREVRTELEQYFENPFLDAVFCIGR